MGSSAQKERSVTARCTARQRGERLQAPCRPRHAGTQPAAEHDAGRQASFLSARATPTTCLWKDDRHPGERHEVQRPRRQLLHGLVEQLVGSLQGRRAAPTVCAGCLHAKAGITGSLQLRA